MQIDAVQQRAAELALVACHLVGRAAAGALAGAEKAARAGVHRGHQLEAGRVFGPLCRTGDGDAAGLQRLAQGFQRTAGVLRKFIEKKDAMVGERDLAGPWGELL